MDDLIKAYDGESVGKCEQIALNLPYDRKIIRNKLPDSFVVTKRHGMVSRSHII